MLRHLKERKTISVERMARKFSVSPLTIRRDLELFEAQGFVRRHYGGASIIDGAVGEDPTKTSATNSTRSGEFRQLVAKKAATLVEDGDTIFINSSRTALAMLPFIRKKSVSVITNNGNALLCPHDPSVSIFLTGGEVDGDKHSLVGDFALSAIKKINADKCFLGVSGISADGQISTAVLQETMINMLMIEHTKGDVVILADHSRIGKPHNFIIADCGQVAYIVTDSLADPAIVENFVAMGVTVLLAKASALK